MLEIKSKYKEVKP